MAKHTLTVKPRKLFGRKIRILRREGQIPANVFGAKVPSVAIQMDNKEFRKIYKEAGETSLIELTIEGEKAVRPVLISNYAVDPVSNALLHVDFHQVNLKEKVSATIPLHIVGESPAVKDGNLVVSLYTEVSVEALPTDLPEHIDIDVEKLINVGDTVYAKDLNIDHKKVTLEIDQEEIIVSIQAPAKVEEPVVAEVVEGETKEGEEGKVPEGEGEGDKKEAKSE